MTGHNPQERLEYKGDLRPVLERAIQAFDLGILQDYTPALVGYEDYNAKLTTDNGEYFTKIFAYFRTPDEIARYEQIMQAVMSAGVRHPKMHQIDSGLVFKDKDSNTSLVVMDYVLDNSFYELKRVPTETELDKVL